MCADPVQVEVAEEEFELAALEGRAASLSPEDLSPVVALPSNQATHEEATAALQGGQNSRCLVGYA